MGYTFIGWKDVCSNGPSLFKEWWVLLNDIDDIIRILGTPSVVQTPPMHGGLTPRRVAQVPIPSPR
jgi:hypothetical protein